MGIAGFAATYWLPIVLLVLLPIIAPSLLRFLERLKTFQWGNVKLSARKTARRRRPNPVRKPRKEPMRT